MKISFDEVSRDELLATAIPVDITEEEFALIFPSGATDMAVSKWKIDSQLLETVQERLKTESDEIFLFETALLSQPAPEQWLTREILTVLCEDFQKTFESGSEIENFAAMLAWAAEDPDVQESNK